MSSREMISFGEAGEAFLRALMTVDLSLEISIFSRSWEEVEDDEGSEIGVIASSLAFGPFSSSPSVEPAEVGVSINATSSRSSMRRNLRQSNL